MASQDKKISSLTEWIYSSVEGAANMVVAHAGGNYRIVLSTLKQYVLGNREIGSTATGSVVTNNASQVLSNKALVNPDINGTIVSVTGQNINHLHGLSENVQSAIDNLTHDMSAAESHIDAVEEEVDALQADKIYSARHSASGTSIVLSTKAIDTSNNIDPKSLSISVYEYYVGAGTTLKLLNPSNITISTSDEYLSNITIGDVVPGTAYQIVIRYRVAA